MKKILLAIIVIVVIIYLSDKIYQWYSRTHVNSDEAVILLNDHLADEEVDAFFHLNKGTYDPNKHRIVYSLLKKNGYLLDAYIELPAKQKRTFAGSSDFECNIDYALIEHYGFYDYEVGNRGIVARMIIKEADARKQLSPPQVLWEKQLNVTYQFGEINILDIDKNGISKHCK